MRGWLAIASTTVCSSALPTGTQPPGREKPESLIHWAEAPCKADWQWTLRKMEGTARLATHCNHSDQSSWLS